MEPPLPARSGSRTAGVDHTPAAYAHPPLVETWLAVEFAAGGPLSDPQRASLCQALGPEWPGAWKPLEGEPAPPGPAALQLTNVMGDRALRLAGAGFAFGWLGYTGERYARYEAVRDGFVTVLDSIRGLLERGGTPLKLRRWTVQYKNRIPRGTVWSTPGEWPFFSLWQPALLNGLGVDLAGSQAGWRLPLEAGRGTLEIDFQHVPAALTDECDCVWLNLTTSGPVDETEASLFNGLDHGRTVIVRSFNELVSTEAKAFWGERPR